MAGSVLLLLALGSLVTFGRQYARALAGPAVLAALLLASCGGGSSAPSGTGQGPSNPGTPAGTYAIVVTGTSVNGSSQLQHTANLSLTVN